MACAGSRLSDTSDSFLLILPKALFIQQHAHILFIPLFNFIFIYCGALSRARIIKCLPRFDHMVTAASGRVRAIQKQAKSNLKTILFTGLLEFIKQHVARAHAWILTHTGSRIHLLYIANEPSVTFQSFVSMSHPFHSPQTPEGSAYYR